MLSQVYGLDDILDVGRLSCQAVAAEHCHRMGPAEGRPEEGCSADDEVESAADDRLEESPAVVQFGDYRAAEDRLGIEGVGDGHPLMAPVIVHPDHDLETDRHRNPGAILCWNPPHEADDGEIDVDPENGGCVLPVLGPDHAVHEAVAVPDMQTLLNHGLKTYVAALSILIEGLEEGRDVEGWAANLEPVG